MPKISICMIVKNEEEGIRRCLETAQGIGDEILIADTGSTDNTLEIIKSVGIEPLHYEWSDNFSAARNYVLEKATGDWILALDGDECIAPADYGTVRTAVGADSYDSYRMEKRSYVNNTELLGFIKDDESYDESEGYKGWISEPNDLLFRNKPNIRYEDVIHETVGKSLIRGGYRMGNLDVPIHHYGRNDMSRKNDLYKKLIEARIKADPGDAQAWFYKGTHSDWDGYFEIAEESYLKSLDLFYTVDAVFGLALVRWRLKKVDLAEKGFIEFLRERLDSEVAWSMLFDVAMYRKDVSRIFYYIEKAQKHNAFTGKVALRAARALRALKYDVLAKYYEGLHAA